MKRIFLPLLLLSLLPSVAFAADPNELIKVPCEEFRRLTGERLPCDAIPVLTMKRSQYEAAEISSKRKACRSRVIEKYREWITLTENGTITQNEPPADSKEPWMSCGSVRLWHPENYSYDCSEELQACKEIGKKEAKPAPRSHGQTILGRAPKSAPTARPNRARSALEPLSTDW